MRATLLLTALVGCSEYGLSKPDDVPGTAVEPDTAGSSGTGDTTGSGDSGSTDTSARPDQGTEGDADADADADTDADTDVDTDTGFPEDLCDKASRTTGYLDHFQTSGDGKVLFCHREGGPNYVEIDTDVSACLSHLDHDLDVFPTTGCDS